MNLSSEESGQLMTHVSAENEVEGCTMSGDDRKKKDEAEKNINLRKYELLIYITEKISRFQEEGPMGDDETYLSENKYHDNVSINLQIYFAQHSEHLDVFLFPYFDTELNLFSFNFFFLFVYMPFSFNHSDIYITLLSGMD